MSKNSEARPRRGTQTGSVEFSLTMPSRCAVIMREETITTYIALFNLTDAGIKAAKNSPRRLAPPRSYWPTLAER